MKRFFVSAISLILILTLCCGMLTAFADGDWEIPVVPIDVDPATCQHSYVSNVVAPTAYDVGYTLHTCSICKDSYKDNYTSPTGKVSGFKCKARTVQAQTVIWNKVAGVTGYQVQRSNAAANKWEVSQAVTSNSYTFKSLKAGNNYKFRVRFYKRINGKNYFGAWSATLNSPTLPSATSLTKVTAGSKSFTANWKKQAVTGYQVQYSLKSNFSGAKTVTIKNAKTLKTTVKKLSAKKVYYVRVRTYKTISKVNYFSTWSKTYKMKTK